MFSTRSSRPWFILALIAGAGCQEVTAPHPGPVQSVQLDERLVHAYTGFGLTLFGQLAAETPYSNVFVSPTSAAFALAMTYNGAAGETAQQMARVLGIQEMTLEEANRANRDWLATLAHTGDPKVELALANSIWALQGFPFRPAFLDRNRTFYNAEVRELPFDDAALGEINGWVKSSTRGKIDKIINEISPNDVMYLINALYFKGQWKYQFEKSRTRSEAFHLPDGSTVNVPLMQQRAQLPYRRGDGFQAVSLPYGNGRFSMMLMLPEEGTDLATIYERLTPESWDAWMAELRDTEVDVALPRFRIEWERSLRKTLIGMGMERAFRGADFSEMSPAGGLFIGDVLQKTFVEVNEEGTEAAAVTAVTMRVTSGGNPVLRFDRPFFYAIRDNATGTLLFLGQVVDPR